MLLHDLKPWCKTLLQFEKGLLEFFPVIFLLFLELRITIASYVIVSPILHEISLKIQIHKIQSKIYVLNNI